MAQQAVAVSDNVIDFALNNNKVSGSIVVTAITQTPPSMTIFGSGAGWSATTVNGVSTITLNPATYPIVYTLTFALDSSVAQSFSFAAPVGEITFVSGTVQSCGFLLLTPVLSMFHAEPPETADVTYNLALQFQTTGANPTTFWINDPTIVFEPPV